MRLEYSLSQESQAVAVGTLTIVAFITIVISITGAAGDFALAAAFFTVSVTAAGAVLTGGQVFTETGAARTVAASIAGTAQNFSVVAIAVFTGSKIAVGTESVGTIGAVFIIIGDGVITSGIFGIGCVARAIALGTVAVLTIITDVLFALTVLTLTIAVAFRTVNIAVLTGFAINAVAHAAITSIAATSSVFYQAIAAAFFTGRRIAAAVRTGDLTDTVAPPAVAGAVTFVAAGVTAAVVTDTVTSAGITCILGWLICGIFCRIRIIPAIVGTLTEVTGDLAVFGFVAAGDGDGGVTCARGSNQATTADGSYIFVAGFKLDIVSCILWVGGDFQTKGVTFFGEGDFSFVQLQLLAGSAATGSQGKGKGERQKQGEEFFHNDTFFL